MNISNVSNNNIFYKNPQHIFSVSFGNESGNDSFEKQEIIKTENKSFFSKLRDKVEYFIVGKIFTSATDDKQLSLLKEEELKFKKTPEGIRRSNMSDEEIKSNAENTLNDVFNELKISQSQQPKFIVTNNKYNMAAAYHGSLHCIVFSTEAYKSCPREMEQILMHEMTHCNEALKRAGIPQYRANDIVKSELTKKIINGENSKIPLVKKTIKPPKMSKEMKLDFAKFANDNLYLEKPNKAYGLNFAVLYRQVFKNNNITLLNITNRKMINELKMFIEKYPEFKEQYGNEEKALQKLINYSLSHFVRYEICTDTKFRHSNVDVKELQGEELKEAEKSLIDYIDTFEGNALLSNKFDKKSTFLYQFCPEEVLAENNGYRYSIKCIEKKYKEMQQNGTLTQADKKYMDLQLKYSNMKIEYLTKGLHYRYKFTSYKNNPNNQIKNELENEREKINKMAHDIHLLYEELLSIGISSPKLF